MRVARGGPLGDRDEEPRHDHHARDHRCVEPGDSGEDGDGDEEEDLEEEPRDGEPSRPRRVDGADPGRALADDGTALVPPGVLAVLRGKAPGLLPERMHLGLEASHLR